MILVWSNGTKLGKIIYVSLLVVLRNMQTFAIDDVRIERREKSKKAEDDDSE